MPILRADVKSLELVSAAYLSKDPVLYEELLNKVDLHSNNQVRFGFPKTKEGRVVAKVFVFRLLYGGGAYSYANDPDFTGVSKSQDYWQRVIDAFYEKYQGIYHWHIQLIKHVGEYGTWTSPTGRQYTFTLNKWGKWPDTLIKNYPVQGFGADLVAILRVSLWRRMQAKGYKSLLINTIHDSIELDCVPEEVEQLKEEILKVFRDLPANFERLFKVTFDLPLNVEFS